MQNNIEEINEDLEKVVDGSKFDEIIEDISKWGKIFYFYYKRWCYFYH
jgi:putative heme iron utilization protein